MENIKIMLVDDEPDFLEIMGAVIRGWNYNVITASDGREALEMLKSAKPDIIVLDYLMPGMDGIEVLKEMRKTDKGVPVIMFTAHPNMKVIKGTERLSISAFIPKLSTYSDVSASLKSTIEMIVKSLHKKE
ncbi:MAG: response regulator [Candidatus Omnitrophica bacterium]|nr:response regulator [Candidatus Omnitrophota bacterium]